MVKFDCTKKFESLQFDALNLHLFWYVNARNEVDQEFNIM